MKTLADHYFCSCLDYLEAKGLASKVALSAIDFNEYTNKQSQQLAPRISLKSYNALLGYAQQALNDPLFGFELGKQIRTADFGVLGYLIESSTNLASAITALLNYDSLVANIGRAKFEQQKTRCKVTWVADPQCSSQAVLRNMTAWVSVVRQLLNPELSPSCVYFSTHFSNTEQHRLTNWFNCPVKAGASFNQIEFPSNYLTLPFKTDNSQINAMLKQMSEQQLSQFKSQQLLSEKINHILMAKHDLQDCSLLRTAAALNMTPRTVQRHLKKEKTTFAVLLEAEQKRRLLTYIPHYSLNKIAFMLGFNDQSSFNRAFKRWYHCSPRQFIKNNN